MRAKGADEAIPAFESALALAATIGERVREAAIRNVLGILEWERGRYTEALRHYEAALVLVRNQGHRAHGALILNSLGVSLTRLGRPDEARTVLEQSLTISRDIGERQLEADGLTALGQVCPNAHDLKGAAGCFEQSRAVRHAIGNGAGEGWMHLRLAALRTTMSDGPGARDAMAAARSAAADANDNALSTACAEAARETP